VGSVCRLKRFTTGSRNFLKDVRKSHMMPEQFTPVEIATEATGKGYSSWQDDNDSVTTALGCSQNLAYSTMHDRLKFRKVCARWMSWELKEESRKKKGTEVHGNEIWRSSMDWIQPSHNGSSSTINTKIFGFHKVMKISCPTERLSAFQVSRCFMEIEKYMNVITIINLLNKHFILQVITSAITLENLQLY
jgi:hypothetical protein